MVWCRSAGTASLRRRSSISRLNGSKAAARPTDRGLSRFVRADVEGATELERIAEEVARPRPAVRAARADVGAAVDCRGSRLERPLGRRAAYPVIAEAVHERITVVDAVRLTPRIAEGPTRVVVEVVIAVAIVGRRDGAQHVRDGRGHEVVLEHAVRLHVAVGAGVEQAGGGLLSRAVDIECVVVDPGVHKLALAPGA